jgi:hypothetical protein
MSLLKEVNRSVCITDLRFTLVSVSRWTVIITDDVSGRTLIHVVHNLTG